MIRFPFNEKKTAQAAAYLLTMCGGQLPYISLVKMLYLADRHTLIEIGQPITGDRYVSMKNGPVLSRVLDIIHMGEEPSRDGHEWLERISAPTGDGYTVRARTEAPDDSELSDYEIGVLQNVAETYGKMDRWDLVRFTHTLPEWMNNRSAIAIDPELILRAAGKSDEDIERIASEAQMLMFMRQLAS